MYEGKQVSLDPETVRYMVCRHMGWDYWTYRRQPVSFLDEVIEHMKIDMQNPKGQTE